MQINIKLSKNFTTQWNKLQAEYGEEIARINGFDDNQLSYTDFIDNFIDEKVVADASIDGNSNVSHKDIVTLEKEMPKPHEKLLAFNKIYYEIQKKYGFKVANEWLRLEWEGKLYMHDANTATFKSYCYKGEELLTIHYHDEIRTISFSELYDFIQEEEEWDNNLNQYVKYPINLFVLDLNIAFNPVWTAITRMVKHKNKKSMRFIKYANGLSQIVTEDHPIITENGDIPAKEVTTEDRVYTEPPIDVLTCKQKIYPNWMNKDFGWLTGMCLSEASALPSEIYISQHEEEQYNKIIDILNKFQMPFKEEHQYHRIRLKVSEQEKFLEQMLINKTSVSKQLPSDFLFYPTEYLDGIVAGLIDGDGTIGGYKNRQCQVRIASEVLCHQISDYLKRYNIFCGDRTPHKYKSEKSFEQKLPLFGIAFTLTNEEYFSNIGSIKIKNKYIPLVRKGDFKNKKYQYNYGWVNIIENSEYIESCPIVYDITTKSGHFLCNNVLSHNCFAYDLKDLAEKGLYFIEGRNAKPAAHYITFVDFIKEFISFAANRTSGAVGLPNLIPYMYYFWKKDIDEGYLGMHNAWGEYYAKQGFQRFIYAVNQPYVRDGSQSAFTNTSVFDRPYFEALFGGAEFPDGSFMIDAEEEIIEFQKWYMETMAEIRSENMFTFPVSTISLLRQNGKFVDEDFAIWAVAHNMKWSDSNLFVDNSVNSLSNCCRLKSDIRDLGYFNSIGGTALKVGSVKVNTVNLARLALDTETEEEYLEELEKRTEVCLQALDAVRYIIKRNVDKGLLPNFSYNLIDFDHLYNTIGFLGVYETMKAFGYTYKDEFGNTFYKEEASNFGKKIFETMRKTADVFIEKYNLSYKINTEQIPGESAAAKLMKKDKFFYPNANIYDLPLYGNQFMPLGIQSTLQERVRVQALFDSYCNGGSILHANIDAPFDSFDKAWKMVNYIAEQGVTYFAFNTKIQACEDNHAFYGMTCPQCGKPVATEFTRIVGFYTPVKTWSKERSKEYTMRRWEGINTTAENI